MAERPQTAWQTWVLTVTTDGAGPSPPTAQELLEATPDGIESISCRVGFASPGNLREQFRRVTGVSPQSYRNTFHDETDA
ncbi:MAG: helix-turn-helix domain-containing protein [Mycobacterium sp.]|uniref:helix-turn-helix domain-containing protein n=1 Tax=Mycobacterium sp. TaxID=1785 RepID=UPI003F9B6587